MLLPVPTGTIHDVPMVFSFLDFSRLSIEWYISASMSSNGAAVVVNC